MWGNRLRLEDPLQLQEADLAKIWSVHRHTITINPNINTLRINMRRFLMSSLHSSIPSQQEFEVRKCLEFGVRKEVTTSCP